ncbi:MAG: hypothetical protein JW854_08310 [Actinobacteria bacterium]|nr:hypothetical protein [Actinomycetota bacterium]
MRKVVIILTVLLLCAGGVAFAAWSIVDDGGDNNTAVVNVEGESFESQLEETTSEQGPDAADDSAAEGEVDSADTDVEAVDYQTGEDFSYTTPDQRYVTETQRHQNFFRAVAEGRVNRLEVTRADVRPVGDTNSSYIYFTLTTDGGTSNGTFVMKYANGMWRIAAINQLSGDLSGGTNYMVPESFEEDLGREIAELQPFLTKVAEGRFAYMEVYSASRPSESESVLTGVVVGKSGKTVPAEMRLRKDYGIWHLVYITDPP